MEQLEVFAPDSKEPPFYFINPSTSNICVTNDGLILDTCQGKALGLWNPRTGKCVKLFRHIIMGLYCKLNYFSQYDKILISDEKCLKIFDYKEEKIIKVIQIGMFLDEIIDHIEPNYLVGINSGMVYLWDLETGTVLKKLKAGTKARNFIRLEDGNYLVRNNDGDIYMIKSDLSSMDLINTQGSVFSFCSLKNKDFAVGRNQSIHILEVEKFSISRILKGFDEVYISLLYINDGEGRILSGSNKATLRLWDIKTAKCLKLFGDKDDQKYLELHRLCDTSHIIAINNESKKIRVWDLGKYEDPNDKPVPVKLIEGDLSNIQKIIRVDEEDIAILCFAQYFDGQLIFLQEIRIFNYVTNTYKSKKQINRGQFIVEPSSMISVHDGKILLYLTKSVGFGKDILHLWDYSANDEVKYEFNVENNITAIFCKFERIIVPFSLSFCYNPPPPPNLVSVAQPKGVNIKGPSGINIYDFTMKSIFKLEFDIEFMATAVEMIDKERLIFINFKNQMEWWNIREKKLIKKIECNPNIFTSLRFSKKILFMVTNTSEIIVWDAEHLSLLQKRKKPLELEVVKIEVIDYDCYVLYNNGILEKWNLRKNDVKNSKLNFHISDFYIDKYLFLLGDVLIQAMELSKAF